MPCGLAVHSVQRHANLLIWMEILITYGHYFAASLLGSCLQSSLSVTKRLLLWEGPPNISKHRKEGDNPKPGKLGAAAGHC